MKTVKLTQDQIKKVAFSVIGFVVLVYVYFTFFLGPLNKSRQRMLASMHDKQDKLERSKGDLSKMAKLEIEAKSATSHFAAFKALNPGGAPIAWFPPRIKTFFANEQIDKAVARLGNSISPKEPELADWMKYSWLISLPEADYATLGKAIADLENTEPLLVIEKITIHARPDQPGIQQVEIAVTNVIQKK